MACTYDWVTTGRRSQDCMGGMGGMDFVVLTVVIVTVVIVTIVIVTVVTVVIVTSLGKTTYHIDN